MSDQLDDIADELGVLTDERKPDDGDRVVADGDVTGETLDVQDEYDGGWSTER